MPNVKDLVGQVFGRLTVLSRGGNDNRGRTTWLCACVCGSTKVVGSRLLITGRTTSCGCLRRVDPDRAEKRCTRCRQVKPIGDFYRSANQPDGKHHTCKMCRRQEKKDWHQRSYIQATHGLSPERYQEMVRQQEGRCRICKEDKPLVVDHDHGSGVVRGLLCQNCNRGLGMFRDSSDRLLQAVAYLKG
jgi:hypothetical protein